MSKKLDPSLSEVLPQMLGDKQTNKIPVYAVRMSGWLCHPLNSVKVTESLLRNNNINKPAV